MLAFAIVSLLMFITPGPGVLSLAGVGAAFGWQHGLRYMAGLFADHVYTADHVANRMVCGIWLVCSQDIF